MAARSATGTQTLGILGGGQLGRMLALAAAPLGVRCQFLDPSPQACAAGFGGHVCADFAAGPGRDRFAIGLDAATLEFENVPTETVDWLAARVPTFPRAEALACAQDRAEEKTRFGQLGIGTPPWRAVDELDGLRDALAQIGTPAVLKTRRFGYDGKGQVVLRSAADAAEAWAAVSGAPCVLEGFVDFAREVSMVAARGRDGAMVFYPLTENVHADGILRRSTPLESDPLQAEAEAAIRALAESIDYVGVLAFEFFDVGEAAGGAGQPRLLANEFAPRVHNSGHWTIEGAETSQFENHVRAVMGLPLGDTRLLGPVAMVNVIGTSVDVAGLAAQAGVHPHSYEKAPRPGRKTGHITVRAASIPQLRRRLAGIGC